jgi:uncharacterized membrane protein YhdT
MTHRHRQRGATTPAPPRWAIALGLLLRSRWYCSALAVPADAGRWLGIDLRIWCLFACAPVTSVCLALCYRFTAGSPAEDDRA